MIVSAKVVGSGISYATYSAQAPGVGRGHREFILSRGELMNVAFNPKRWLDGYREDEADTDATRWGSMIECLAGLSGNFSDLYAVAPAEYKDDKGNFKPWNWNSTFCKNWREEQGGREVIKSDLHAKACSAVESLEEDRDVSELFRCSEKQVMVIGVWLDKATSVEIPIRCLIDLVPSDNHQIFNKCLADFKTARESSPDFWDGVVNKSGYDVQAALGILLYEKASGEKRTDWLWPLQQNVHPYYVTSPMPAATVEFLKWGREKLETALARYAKCLATGHWPSFSTRNRLVIQNPPCQMIGPEGIYAYRESGGAIIASRQEYEPEPRKEPEEQFDVPH